MSTRTLCVLLAVAVALLASLSGAAAVNPALCLQNVTIISAVPGAKPGLGSVTIDDSGTIMDVLYAQFCPSSSKTIMTLAGQYLIPGLIDSHTHTSSIWPQDANFMPHLFEWALRKGGLTTLRDMGGDVLFIAPYAQEALIPAVPAPRIYYSALVGGPAFMEDPRVQQAAHNFTAGALPWLRAVTYQTNLPLAVREALAIGATGVKIYADLTGDLVGAVSQEALKQGLHSWAHAAVFPARPSDVLHAGVQTLSHSAYLVWEPANPIPDDYTKRFDGDYAHTPYNSANITGLLRQMRDANAILDATVYVFTEDFPPLSQQWIFNVTRLAAQMGVRVSAGTDDLGDPCMNPFPNLHVEMQLLVEQCGFSPYQAITAATLTGAQILGIDKNYGTIEPGKVADLVVLSADPLANITNSASVAWVVKEGQMYPAMASRDDDDLRLRRACAARFGLDAEHDAKEAAERARQLSGEQRRRRHGAGGAATGRVLGRKSA